MVNAVRGSEVGQRPTGSVVRPGRMLHSHVRVADGAGGLADIRRPGVNLAFWPRELPPEVAAQLSETVSTGFGPVRFEASDDAMDAELLRRLPTGRYRDWFAADAAMLARTLARLSGTRRVKIRIEAVAGDACRRFHADAVALRLVTTYQGRGTQWLANADVDSVRNGAAVPEDRVHEAATGTVAVFRGLGGGTTGHPLVHRSPPRRPGDPVRLFMAVDPTPN